MFVALACDNGSTSPSLTAADAVVGDDIAAPSADTGAEVAQYVVVKQANACTTNDDCVNVGGQCGKPYVCVSGFCQEMVGGQNSPAGTTCDDGNECTIGDHCDAAHNCVAAALSCDDGNSCTNDVCDKSKGCLHVAVSGSCDDKSACTTGDACADGKCVGKAVDCDDKNVCTADACDPAKGCTHTNNAEPCDDGNACNTGDVCKDGKCVGGSATNCDDANPCTADSCVPASGCAHAALVGTKCDDADPNTVGDACGVTGKCVGTAKQCKEDGDCAKLEIDQCNAYKCQNGQCVKDFDSSKDVDDANPCTADACDPKTGVVSHTPIGGACDDGDLCTYADFCVSGKCVGTPNKCDDGNPCTVDTCTDPKKGCNHTTKVCDDGNPYNWDPICGESGTNECDNIIQWWVAFSCGLPNKYKTPEYADAGLYCVMVVWIQEADQPMPAGSPNGALVAKMGADGVAWTSEELCPQLAKPGAVLHMHVLVANKFGDSDESIGGLLSGFWDTIWVGTNDGLKVGKLGVPTLWPEPDTTATFEDFPTCVAAQEEIKKKGSGTP